MSTEIEKMQLEMMQAMSQKMDKIEQSQMDIYNSTNYQLKYMENMIIDLMKQVNELKQQLNIQNNVHSNNSLTGEGIFDKPINHNINISELSPEGIFDDTRVEKTR